MSHPLEYLFEGPEEIKQFFKNSGELHCCRESCEGCPLQQYCVSEESEIKFVTEWPYDQYAGKVIQKVWAEPAIRASIAQEEPFCVLKIKPELNPKHLTHIDVERQTENAKEFESIVNYIPDCLFQFPEVKQSILHELNRHYVVQDPNRKDRLFVMRNQVRYLGNPGDFENFQVDGKYAKDYFYIDQIFRWKKED